MKTLKWLMIAMVWVCFTASIVLSVWALNPQPEPPIPMEKLTLPKGTIVEKIGEGHFKFKLPDGRMVEVKGFSRSGSGKAILGDCILYDRTGKLIAKGKQGSLKSGPKPAEGKVEYLKIDRGFLKIDDEPTWLPATIIFKIESKGKGLSPQPDPPGSK